MKRVYLVLASFLLSTVLTFAQQPSTANPEDRTASTTGQPYTRTTESRGWGGWGLLGLIGLAGLLGRRRESVNTGYARDDRTYEQQRRRVG